ncbi:hypothetical protein BKA64DRAFT_702863 [Cadophora sp. MPI-SDFR-AT-0126]|nr:hypothetical protein BKA64DRAFT_702863 [Leotiomycetes sp. MPI-SDFR-AT-0126]
MALSTNQRKIAGGAIIVALLVVNFFSIISLISLIYPHSTAASLTRLVEAFYSRIPSLPPAVPELVSRILFSLAVVVFMTICGPHQRGNIGFGIVTAAAVARCTLPVVRDCTSIWRDEKKDPMCAAECWTQSVLLLLVCATGTMTWTGIEWDGGLLAKFSNWAQQAVLRLIGEGRLQWEKATGSHPRGGTKDLGVVGTELSQFLTSG